jgi:hypothetical protein
MAAESANSQEPSNIADPPDAALTGYGEIPKGIIEGRYVNNRTEQEQRVLLIMANAYLSEKEWQFLSKILNLERNKIQFTAREAQILKSRVGATEYGIAMIQGTKLGDRQQGPYQILQLYDFLLTMSDVMASINGLLTLVSNMNNLGGGPGNLEYLKQHIMPEDFRPWEFYELMPADRIQSGHRITEGQVVGSKKIADATYEDRGNGGIRSALKYPPGSEGEVLVSRDTILIRDKTKYERAFDEAVLLSVPLLNSLSALGQGLFQIYEVEGSKFRIGKEVKRGKECWKQITGDDTTTLYATLASDMGTLTTPKVDTEFYGGDTKAMARVLAYNAFVLLVNVFKERENADGQWQKYTLEGKVRVTFEGGLILNELTSVYNAFINVSTYCFLGGEWATATMDTVRTENIQRKQWVNAWSSDSYHALNGDDSRQISYFVPKSLDVDKYPQNWMDLALVHIHKVAPRRPGGKQGDFRSGGAIGIFNTLPEHQPSSVARSIFKLAEEYFDDYVGAAMGGSSKFGVAYTGIDEEPLKALRSFLPLVRHTPFQKVGIQARIKLLPSNINFSDLHRLAPTDAKDINFDQVERAMRDTPDHPISACPRLRHAYMDSGAGQLMNLLYYTLQKEFTAKTKYSRLNVQLQNPLNMQVNSRIGLNTQTRFSCPEGQQIVFRGFDGKRIPPNEALVVRNGRTYLSPMVDPDTSNCEALIEIDYDGGKLATSKLLPLDLQNERYEGAMAQAAALTVGPTALHDESAAKTLDSVHSEHTPKVTMEEATPDPRNQGIPSDLSKPHKEHSGVIAPGRGVRGEMPSGVQTQAPAPTLSAQAPAQQLSAPTPGADATADAAANAKPIDKVIEAALPKGTEESGMNAHAMQVLSEVAKAPASSATSQPAAALPEQPAAPLNVPTNSIAESSPMGEGPLVTPPAVAPNEVSSFTKGAEVPTHAAASIGVASTPAEQGAPVSKEAQPLAQNAKTVDGSLFMAAAMPVGEGPRKPLTAFDPPRVLHPDEGPYGRTVSEARKHTKKTIEEDIAYLSALLRESHTEHTSESGSDDEGKTTEEDLEGDAVARALTLDTSHFKRHGKPGKRAVASGMFASALIDSMHAGATSVKDIVRLASEAAPEHRPDDLDAAVKALTVAIGDME